ncbi:MAG: histidine phosphatase family protein [bacterium]|nr:histidine phosphatase family protein [bacterium]
MLKHFTTFYVVRHGESEANVKEAQDIQFSVEEEFNTPLSIKGKSEAKKMAEQFKNIHFDAIFSSDMIRAKETTNIIRNSRKLSIELISEIRERHFGSYIGKWNLVRDKIQELIKNLHDKDKLIYQYEDVETEENAVNRLINFFNKISISHKGKRVLVVCHGNIMRTFLVKVRYGKYFEIPPGSLINNGYFVVEGDGTNFNLKEVIGVNKKILPVV